MAKASACLEDWATIERNPPQSLRIASDYSPQNVVRFKFDEHFISHEESVADRLRERISYAIRQMHDVVSVNPQVRGGTPVLKGTRMPLSRVLAELADDISLSKIALDFDLEKEAIERFLESMSLYLDQPFGQ